MTDAPTTSSPPTSSVSPSARLIWLRSRGLLVALLVLLVAAVVIALLRSGEQRGALDPRSADRNGTRAVAELLADRGIDTRVVTTTAEAADAAAADTTLLVARPELLTQRQLDMLRSATAPSGGRTVLLAPDASTTTLAPDLRAAGEPDTGTLAPRCAADYARRSGSVELGGIGYEVTSESVVEDADTCYPADGLPSLVRVPSADGDTVVVGSTDFLHNERLDEEGNAALALQLLGSREQLVWYLPSPADPAAGDSGDASLIELIPSGWLWGSVQLAIAAVLTAAWRARRLGPLVPERLPVAVPAAEATEGRARLYRQADARDRAADALRAATRLRLAPFLGIAPGQAHSPDTVVPAVARHTGEHTAGHTLLFGPPPRDDAALVRLADDLDHLERRISPASADSTTDKDRPS
ncbi:DUF4350 domain-containing protein [Streptomyces sp. WMMC1477]|uniref:DUF4350 domain-containing protein n=1 Tax=Streptomyces sp. WMMC1477 TaxID=3015155 RepID=UPI0022B73C7E|nr:DUF4350 domain-containing protein [Streptomyces sp. WMMC1477]MCZ7431507.1 DUF4350 domain-containing protein [Streptomyces sp. WMMC1477]